MRQFISGILSFLILFSTLGFSISRHYCQGSLMGAKFGGAVEVCCMDMQETMPDDCCKDEISWLQVEDEIPVFSVELTNYDELIEMVQFIKDFSPKVAEFQHESFQNYFPPPIVNDLQVRLQTFLI